MPPPSKLSIATSSVQRLLKDVESYHKEMEQQEARIKRLEGEQGDENSGYQLRQERQALSETKAVFAPLKQRIANAASALDSQLTKDKDAGSASEEDVAKAETLLSQAKALS